MMQQDTEKKKLEGPVALEITGGQGEISTKTIAQCYCKNQSYYLLFQEGIKEDNKADAISFSSRLKISDDTVVLRRSIPGDGDRPARVLMEMVYHESGKDEPGCFVDYPTPYGVMCLEIRTDRLTIEKTENMLEVRIEYRMLQDSQEVSRDKVQIKVQNNQ